MRRDSHTSDEPRVALGPINGAASEVGLGDLLARVGEIYRRGDLRIKDGAMSHGFVTTPAEELEAGVGGQEMPQPTGDLGEPTMGSSLAGHGAETFSGALTEWVEEGHGSLGVVGHQLAFDLQRKVRRPGHGRFHDGDDLSEVLVRSRLRPLANEPFAITPFPTAEEWIGLHRITSLR